MLWVDVLPTLAEANGLQQQVLQPISPATAVGINGLLQIADLMGQANLQLLSRVVQLHRA